MSPKKNVALLQGLVRNYNQNLQFSDEFIYNVLLNTRAQTMSKKLDKYENVSKHGHQKFCIELVEGDYHTCGDCVPEELKCKVFISKYKIPEVLDGRIREYLDVLTLYNKVVEYLQEEDTDIIQYDDYKKSQPFYSFSNGYLVLWNSKINKVLQLRGLWFDPLDWIGKQFCGTTTKCYDKDNLELYIPASLRLEIFNKALSELNVPLKLTEQDLSGIEKNLAV